MNSLTSASNEFLAMIFIIIVIVDIIIGWVDHTYILEDSISKDQRKALIKKAVEVVIVLLAGFFKDFALLAKQPNEFIGSINAFIVIFIAFMVIYELRSILAHFSSVTGITIPNSINKALGIDQELNAKMNASDVTKKNIQLTDKKDDTTE